MGFGIVLGLAAMSAIVSVIVLASAVVIGQARWQRREGDAKTA